jgi:O-acetyl-ADP-ribose deacetylase (regulator of RNase III)
VEAHCGDLFSALCEAIVVNTDIAVSFRHTLGRELLERFGERLSTDVRTILETLPERRLALGQAVTVPAYNLDPIKNVILVAWWGRDNEFTFRLIESALTNSLRQAFAANILSLACPLIGTGFQHMDPALLHAGIVKVLRELDGLKNSARFSVEELYFISDRSDRVSDLQSYLNRHL